MLLKRQKMRSEFSNNSLRFFFKVFFWQLQCRCRSRNHHKRDRYWRAWIHHHHPLLVLHSGIGCVLRARCPTAICTALRTRLRQRSKHLYDHHRRDWSHHGARVSPPYTVIAFLKSSLRLTNDPLPPFCVSPHHISEYKHSRGGRFATPLRCCARWRPSAIKLDRTRRQQSTTEECGDGHVCICSGAVVLHHTEPSRLHVPHIGWRRTDHRRLWAHRVAAPYVHSALFQVVAFLSRALGTTHVRFDGVVQRARLCGALVYIVIFSYNNNGGFGGYYIGHHRPVLLPGNGQHVQLRLHHLWFSVDLRDPILVLHTCE